MKRLLLILIVLFAVQTYAQEYPITEIHATGSQKFAEEDIVKASGLSMGKTPVSLEHVKQAGVTLMNRLSVVGMRSGPIPKGPRCLDRFSRQLGCPLTP